MCYERSSFQISSLYHLVLRFSTNNVNLCRFMMNLYFSKWNVFVEARLIVFMMIVESIRRHDYWRKIIRSSCISKLCKKLSLEKSLHLANEYGKSSRQFHFFIIVAYVKSWSISVSAVENHITFALLVLLSGLTFLFTLMLTIL